MKRAPTLKKPKPPAGKPGVREPVRSNSENANASGARAACAARPGRIDRRSILVLGLLLTAFVSLQLLLPLSTAIQIGGDEGFELSKAMLYLKGYKFYTEVSE